MINFNQVTCLVDVAARVGVHVAAASGNFFFSESSGNLKLTPI